MSGLFGNAVHTIPAIIALGSVVVIVIFVVVVVIVIVGRIIVHTHDGVQSFLPHRLPRPMAGLAMSGMSLRSLRTQRDAIEMHRLWYDV